MHVLSNKTKQLVNRPCFTFICKELSLIWQNYKILHHELHKTLLSLNMLPKHILFSSYLKSKFVENIWKLWLHWECLLPSNVFLHWIAKRNESVFNQSIEQKGQKFSHTGWSHQIKLLPNAEAKQPSRKMGDTLQRGLTKPHSQKIYFKSFFCIVYRACQWILFWLVLCLHGRACKRITQLVNWGLKAQGEVQMATTILIAFLVLQFQFNVISNRHPLFDLSIQRMGIIFINRYAIWLVTANFP